MDKNIEISDTITVGTLAEKLSIPVTKLIAELMKNGVIASVNERLDFDTAEIIVSEIDPEIKLVKSSSDTEVVKRTHKQVNSDKAQARPPVVAVMGHVDHGKTSLLDAIRGAEVVKKESGGITQHISAYQISHKDRRITFLDTPGHEAFAALREHGAQLTDVALIVVAADDGVKPQTVEAIRFARSAKVKMLVVINKIDKPDSDINKIKQQLADQKILVEGYGGDTVCVEVSAKNNLGIEQLLDMIILVTDVEELKADYDVPASGMIIESHMEQGRGPVAIALVESGTLNSVDYVVAGSTYAKVKNLETTAGEKIEQAPPATPVVITGFKELPQFGEDFIAAKNEKTAKQLATDNANFKGSGSGKSNLSGGELISIINKRNKLTEFNVVIKADVQGSLTSVVDSLRALNNDEVAVQIISTGVGVINEGDVYSAHTSNAVIYAFNVMIPAGPKRLADRDQVSIRKYSVIYELIDDVKVEMNKLLAPEIEEKQLGRLIVKAIFNTTKTEVICGGEVTKGKLKVPALAKVIRGGEELAEVEVVNLKRGPQDTSEVEKGEMCGLSLTTKNKLDLQEGDHLELFTRETLTRTI